MNRPSTRSNYPEKIYDLAIIGAGPAGSLAAILAARTGLSVIMFEKNKHPRSKTCGGFLSSRAISLLPDDLELLSLQSQPVYQINVMKNRIPHTYNSKTRLGLVLRRDELDQLLAEYAVKTGVKLIENEIVESVQTVKPDDYNKDLYLLKSTKNKDVNIFANYLIIADGANSNNASKVGLSGKCSLCGWGLSKVIKMDSPVADTGILKFYPLPFLGGMGWSFSGSGWTNHGVGGLTGIKHLTRVYHKLFPSETEETQEQGTLNAWPLPFLGPMKKNANYNSIVIGDATGLVEPFSGEGLYNSFKSAHLAISAILKSMAEIDSQVTSAEIYNPLFRKYFYFAFIKTLPGASLLHARSILASSTLPSQIAALMNNSLWFNQALDLSAIGADRLLVKDIGD